MLSPEPNYNDKTEIILKRRSVGFVKEATENSVNKLKTFLKGNTTPKSPKAFSNSNEDEEHSISSSGKRRSEKSKSSDEMSDLSNNFKRNSLMTDVMSIFSIGNTTPITSPIITSPRQQITSPRLIISPRQIIFPPIEGLISFLTQKFCVKNFHLNFAFLMKFVPNTFRNVWKINFVLKILNFTK
jgi:hypothetical protein